MFNSVLGEFTHESASIGRRNAIYDRTPNVEVLASSTVGISITGVTERSTGIDIVLVNESETHILRECSALIVVKKCDSTYTYCVVGSAHRTEYQFISFGCIWILEGRQGPAGTLFDIRQRPRRG